MSRAENLIFMLGYLLILMSIKINLWFHFTLPVGKVFTVVAGMLFIISDQLVERKVMARFCLHSSSSGQLK